jgi:hypothetical protein
MAWFRDSALQHNAYMVQRLRIRDGSKREQYQNKIIIETNKKNLYTLARRRYTRRIISHRKNKKKRKERHQNNIQKHIDRHIPKVQKKKSGCEMILGSTSDKNKKSGQAGDRNLDLPQVDLDLRREKMQSGRSTTEPHALGVSS